jgi:hypothetical protein
MTTTRFSWDDIVNPDPCRTHVFEVNACGPAFTTWWLNEDVIQMPNAVTGENMATTNDGSEPAADYLR